MKFRSVGEERSMRTDGQNEGNSPFS